ncbi:hypothetical protein NDK47_24300 [Brevibacillus ruminantium]|uniref:Uncharacterized protein n=1 Tax=Brevibacillus ruminantium TaxID=2950604 RepID=A0ABY4WDS1_9BACL|nr:hypothetical protein [Brevibacillus ruminantium]USG65208.1 hypothetical protein NDK47_24300 [Brevibacillus ruminantium]
MTKQQVVESGLFLIYVKDGTIYPVALTKEQKETFYFLMNILPQPVKYIADRPLGKAVTLASLLKQEV